MIDNNSHVHIPTHSYTFVGLRISAHMLNVFIHVVFLIVAMCIFYILAITPYAATMSKEKL